ncbi:MAG TPA: protein kinase [Terriglobales bacterium]|nr:protein kinase [Terriglobales bacterium]
MSQGSSFSPLGERVGNYQIVSRVGAGGMGVVYKARDLKLDRIVALKFLPEEATLKPVDTERFMREAKTASSLDHPNIGVIHGIEHTHDGRMFIVMAYYEGETLMLRIRRSPIPISEVVDIAVQACRGLSEAHAHNIVHRDIKPSNIILARNNVLKIVDFGLARVISSASITQTAGFSGSFVYMSPEQALGNFVDHRTDIWSLGVVMAEMVTGRPPFYRETMSATLLAIVHQPPSELDRAPAELQKIIYQALSKDPAHRYQHCHEMLSELTTLQAQATSHSSAATVSPTNTRGSRDLRKSLEHASRSAWGVAPQRSWHWWVSGIAGLLILATALSFVPSVRQQLTRRFVAQNEKHIAVLPFDNIGNDPANTAIAEGLMDSLSSRLSNLDAANSSLWVVPASVVRARNVQDPASALRDLGATLVVKGSIQRQGKDVHLTVDLIDTQNLRQIGSVPLEDRAGDLAGLQDQAVARLAGLMKISLPGNSLASSNVAPVAYESYLKALGYVQRYDKPGNLELAISALQSAVQTDSGFALGYAELGEAYRLKNQVDPNPKWIEEASANCERAIQIDSHLPSTYVTLGRLHADLGKNELALQEFQRALQINPRDADALMGVALAYEHMGRTVDAEENLKRAAALRPDYWDGYNSLGGFYYRQGRLADAITQYRRVIQLTPDNANAYSNLGAALVGLSDPKFYPEAESALKKSIQLSPNYPAYANLGNLYYNEKRYAESVEMTRKALAMNDKNYEVWDNLRLSYEWLHDPENARKAREHAFPLLQHYAAEHPHDAAAQALLATFYAQRGAREEALRRVESALAVAPKDGAVLAAVAEAYEYLGDRKQALAYANRSLTDGATVSDLQDRPGLQSMLTDPGFRPNMKK